MITGYACLYGMATIIDKDGVWCEEVVSAGAFARSVQRGFCRQTGKPIFCTINHRRRRHRLADTSDGRLRLFDEPRGLRFELDDVDLPEGFTGMSYQFFPQKWQARGSKGAVLLKGDLEEISFMVRPYTPANPSTFRTIRVVQEISPCPQLQAH